MIYIDEEGRTQCTDCCIRCKENQKTCEAKKERGRWARRMAYKARKEHEKKLKEGD